MTNYAVLKHCSFITLFTFDISSNKLSHFKLEQSKVPKLETLILFNNNLETLEINSSTLKKLDFSSNKIKSKYLNLNCPILEYLKANNNLLVEIDLQYSSLLDLYKNLIEQLGFNNENQRNLERLYLYSNNLNPK